jgi:O-antigen/teichoic acid export membrane protein
VPLAGERRDILSFVGQSTAATAVISLTAPQSVLVLGRVTTTRQVAYFRAALSPQQAFAVVSAPARLILLTEQTRAWERGRRDVVFKGVRRYMGGMAVLAGALLVPLLVFTPELAKLLFSAKNVGAVDATRVVIIAGALRMVFGWTKSFPVSIGRPSLRIWTHGLETLVLIPLVGILGAEWGATGAAFAVLISSVVFCLAWTFLFFRIEREPPPADVLVDPVPLEAVLP